VGSPLPGGAELRLVAFDEHSLEPTRDDRGRAREVAWGELGLLLSRVDPRARALEVAVDLDSVLHDVFESGDAYASTGDLLCVDGEGDYRFVGRGAERVSTALGYVSPRPVEDALLELDAVREAFAFGAPGPSVEQLELALVLRGADENLASLSARVAELPELERPARLHLLSRVPLTEGFRADADATRALLAQPHPVYVWDALSSRYRPRSPEA